MNPDKTEDEGRAPIPPGPRPGPKPPQHWSDDLKTGCAGAFFAFLILLCVVVAPAVELLDRMRADAAMFPLVLVGAASVAVAVGWLASFGSARIRRDRDRAARGLCVRCGYDLRASFDRCPECGRRLRRRVR